MVAGLLAAGAFREVLVVDDGSSDATAARAEAAGARVVRHPYNKGNGAAVKTGIREAQGDVVLLHGRRRPARPRREPQGHRAHRPARHGDRRPRRRGPGPGRAPLGNAIFRALACWLTGRPIPDLTSGFRAAKRERLLEILHLLPNGFSYPTTSCLAFLKAGHNVAFVPDHARGRGWARARSGSSATASASCSSSSRS